MTLDLDRLLLEAGPLEAGIFLLMKCVFIEEGKNAPRAGRCENLSYGSLNPAMGTAYENQIWETGVRGDLVEHEVKVTEIIKFEHIVSLAPHFFIDYAQIKTQGENGSTTTLDFQKKIAPSSMWIGRSIYQLFKTMREWSFMIEEPFNSDHPMALYSKMAINLLEVPQPILDEIDAMPDMHLAMFLKGQDDYKLIPSHPIISQTFKQWIIDTSQKYPVLTFEQKLNSALSD